jgi:hypothetical protein
MYSLVAYYGAIERSAAGSAEAVVKSGQRLRAVGVCSRTAVQRAGDRRPSLQQLPPRRTPVSTRHCGASRSAALAQVAQGASEWSASAPDGTTVHELEALVAEMDSHAGACAGAPMAPAQHAEQHAVALPVAGGRQRCTIEYGCASDGFSARRCDGLRIRFDQWLPA